ncbi:hypothetical protein [Altibacter sp. HG106]|uniref:hypothetical protein n=1 Tax=Altibacter sp. HG106 TaxID=3023937 RepID=UPI002350CB8D|nr:hypothetical protein [Altibacter sp. HG106]MDC7994402.1 hypothetical protein [Altibacter sp. HG106]
MLQKVISHPGFWRSVILLGIIYMLVLFFLQWMFLGFDLRFLSARPVWVTLLVFLGGILVCGFSVTYAKFWAKIKRNEHRS